MQISVAAERRFAVIQVKSTEVFHPHYLVKVIQRLLKRYGSPQIISRGVNVTRVEADPDSFLVVHEGDDVAQIFKGGANDVPAACHGLKYGRHSRGGCVGPVESLGNAGNGGRSGVAASRAGVEVVESDTTALRFRGQPCLFEYSDF